MDELIINAKKCFKGRGAQHNSPAPKYWRIISDVLTTANMHISSFDPLPKKASFSKTAYATENEQHLTQSSVLKKKKIRLN